MISFPNIKINLGLNILSKRTDGYHNLQSIFYPVNWCDILEIVKSDSFDFQASGLKIPGNPADNIVVKAYELIKSEHRIGQVSMFLHKAVPTGAGLGAGSSNGAFALKMLDELFELNLSKEQLLDYAGRLGSDCPFFIENAPCHVSGRGEILQKIDLNLSDYWIKIIHPGIHISTKEAFAKITPKNQSIDLLSVQSSKKLSFYKHFINDFEIALSDDYPEVITLKSQLVTEGAFYASMSGSGSAVFGLFDKEPTQTESKKFEFIGKLNSPK